MTPHEKLWQAVIHRALLDATAVDPSGLENIRAKPRADSWLRGCGPDFRMVCALAGFDPEFVSDAYVAGRIDGELLRHQEKREATE